MLRVQTGSAMKDSLAWLCAFAIFCTRSPTFADGTLYDDRPNIVFILVDDLAWSDLGCYGHPWHRTPHIDSLANDGMRFTNAYAAAPICSASRASILTGKTTARLGFEFVTKHKRGPQKIDATVPMVGPPITLDLPLAEITFAERVGFD